MNRNGTATLDRSKLELHNDSALREALIDLRSRLRDELNDNTDWHGHIGVEIVLKYGKIELHRITKLVSTRSTEV